MIVLVGKTCSGKNTLAEMIEKTGRARRAVYTTTRNARIGEANGVDYFFVTESEFMSMKGEMVDCDIFNNWHYGITRREYQSSGMMILTPRGLERFTKSVDRKSLFVIYIDTPIGERYSRIMKRGDDPHESFRRFVADEQDFENFRDWDLSINGSYSSMENLIKIF
jgi:guanylate kinase